MLNKPLYFFTFILLIFISNSALSFSEKSISIDNNNKIDAKITYSYDPIGEYGSSIPTVTHYIKYSYDKTGNLIKAEMYSLEPEDEEELKDEKSSDKVKEKALILSKSYDYKYNKDNLLSEEIITDKISNKITNIFHSYNNEKLKVKTVFTSKLDKSSKPNEDIYKYSYNEKKQLYQTSFTSIKPNSTHNSTTYIKYNEKNIPLFQLEIYKESSKNIFPTAKWLGTWWIYSDKDELIGEKKIRSDGGIVRNTRFWSDEDGYYKQILVNEKDKVFIQRYDERHFIKEKVRFNVSDYPNSLSKISYEYDENNNIKKQIIPSSPNAGTIIEYTYNEQNQLIKEEHISYSNDNKYFEIIEYNYTKDGATIKKIYSDKDKSNYQLYIYDQFGTTLKYQVFIEGKPITTQIATQYIKLLADLGIKVPSIK